MIKSEIYQIKKKLVIIKKKLVIIKMKNLKKTIIYRIMNIQVIIQMNLV